MVAAKLSADMALVFQRENE